MLTCFHENQNAIPIQMVTVNEFATWLSQQNKATQNWLKQFKSFDAGNFFYIPNKEALLDRVICVVNNKESLENLGHLPLNILEGQYKLDDDDNAILEIYMGWGMGAYQFTKYKSAKRPSAQLYFPKKLAKEIKTGLSAIYLVRDLINTPADDMGPAEFANVVQMLGAKYHAHVSQIVGDDLLKNGYAAIHTVGRASNDPPRLIEMRFGDAKDPKITLVGKAVCFDSGGLDLKSGNNMILMKKDMGGAANVLGLATLIMEAKLAVCLRVLIPCVENVISGNAYRPGDIIKTKKGLTVEVGNTDAEGRLILADALSEAVNDRPALLIDLATLTGAARVALGPDLPALFSNNHALAQKLIAHSEKTQDPLWHMPLFPLYNDYIKSNIADLNNAPSEPYGGAISAALFLQAFVPDEIPWAHIDMTAWNFHTRASHPFGGEAVTIRAIYSYIKEKYAS